MSARSAHALALIAGLLACSIAIAAGEHAASGPAVKAIARPQAIRVGDQVTIEIAARGLREAGAVAFHLLFDPSLLEPVPGGFTEGPFLGQGGASTSFMAAPASTGERILAGVTRLGAPAGASGSGVLCRLTFRAIAPGATSVVFDRASVTSPSGCWTAARFEPARIRIAPAKRAAAREVTP